MNDRVKYYLEIADNALILSHRLSENSSKAPFLEEDLACTNVALDLIGLAESVYNEAARIEFKGNSGDDLAYRRMESDYYNSILVEQPNTDYAHIMVRQFFADTFNYYFFTALSTSTDNFLAAVSRKSLQEVTYHLRRSSEWMLRFGNGTDESQKRAQNAINALWPYTGELFQASDADQNLRSEGISIDLQEVNKQWVSKVNEVLYLAHLKKPESNFQLAGGKNGIHSEYLGYILAEMQFLTNKYPDAIW